MIVNQFSSRTITTANGVPLSAEQEDNTLLLTIESLARRIAELRGYELGGVTIKLRERSS